MGGRCTVVSSAALAVMAGLLSGCADWVVVNDSDVVAVATKNEEPGYKIPSEYDTHLTMDDAAKFANYAKAAILSTAKSQFNIGQGVTGATLGLLAGATGALVFTGDQSAAAGAALGAGALSIGDRYLLVDESLTAYASADAAIDCGKTLLAPLGKAPDAAATAKLLAADLPRPPTIFDLLEGYADKTLMKSGNKDMQAFGSLLADPTAGPQALAVTTAAVAPYAQVVSADSVFMRALTDAADGGPGNSGTERASTVLVIFVKRVLSEMNLGLLKKRATPDEIQSSFQTIVDAYVKKIADKKKKAEDAHKDAQTTIAAIKDVEARSPSLDAPFKAAAGSALTTRAVTMNILDLAAYANAERDTALANVSDKVPADEALEACALKISGVTPPKQPEKPKE